jgi:hypothetical protein
MRVLLAVVGLLLSAGAYAATYVYSGPGYDTVTGVYSPGQHVTGSFTTAGPLPGGLVAQPIGPGGLGLVQSWSFSDGVHALLTNANSIPILNNPANFSVSTDLSGTITAFGIGLESPLPPNDFVTPENFIRFSSISTRADYGLCGAATPGTMICSALVESASYAFARAGGTFSLAPEAVPAFSDWGIATLIVVMGVLGIGGSRQRRSGV